ncbi:MAG: TonB-dependent receptor domain-containing protein [Steroidobacteraceae bacterium]
MTLRTVLASVFVAFALITTSLGQAAIKHPIDIPSQELGSALTTLAKQTQIQIVYPTELVEGRTSRAISGSMTPEEALGQLLAPTGLGFERLDEQTVTLSQTGAADAASGNSSSGAQPSVSGVADRKAEERKPGFFERFRVAQVDQGASASATTVAQEKSPGTTTSEADATRLEEIVVSASKRGDETLKEVPGAMTALTGQALNNLGVVDFQDYLPYVPGLSANPSGTVGNPGTYTVILRGLNTGSSQLTATVGYYLDDMALTPSSSNSTGGTYAPDPALGDVDRIEVLKGPQATLYGASTLGGIIKIVSKKPDLTTFSEDVSVSGVTVDDGGSGYSARGAVNIPLIQNTLAARVSAYDREDPGFTNNVLTGDKNINRDYAHGGRLALRYAPMEKLTFDLSGVIQELRSSGNTLEFLDQNTLRPIYGYDNYSTLGNTTTSTQLVLFSLSTNYDTGWGTITNSMGFARYFADYKAFPFTAPFAPFLPRLHLTSPPIGIDGDQIPDSKKTSEELRFTSVRMNNFLWQVGLFYTHEKVADPDEILAVNYPSRALLPAPLNPLLLRQQSGTYDEYAGFGDLTYYFTDALDATVGTRYSHNSQQAMNSSLGLLGAGPAGTVSQGSSASDESYLFDLRYRATQQLSSYLRAASAYRPGGPQTVIAPGIPTSFGPDTDWDYEIGAKGLWLDDTLNANLAVYYIDWRNIQTGTTYSTVTITGNGGNAKSEGVEFDGSYEPVRSLVFGANASYDEAVMTSVNPTNVAGARVGDPLPYTPKWSGALTGDYSLPLAADMKGGVGASWAYTGLRYNTFSGDTLNTREVIPSYPLFGLRGHIDWNQYNLAVNVDNVANRQTFTNVTFRRLQAGQPVPGFGYPLQPLTVRVTLSMSF